MGELVGTAVLPSTRHLQGEVALVLTFTVLQVITLHTFWQQMAS